MKHLFLSATLLLVAATLMACGGSDPSDDPSGPGTPEVGGQTMTTLRYAASDEVIFNPERGFYTELEANLTDGVSENRLKELRLAGKSLVQLLYYIGEYNDKNLSEAGLKKLGDDFVRVRAAGLKVILVPV